MVALVNLILQKAMVNVFCCDANWCLALFVLFASTKLLFQLRQSSTGDHSLSQTERSIILLARWKFLSSLLQHLETVESRSFQVDPSPEITPQPLEIITLTTSKQCLASTSRITIEMPHYMLEASLYPKRRALARQ